MDLETENRIAAILLKEAAELRRRAEKEGVEVYLHQPNVRGRPNSRFLTATVLGVQQANRAVEENEMWRARRKELDLDERLKGKLGDKSGDDKSYRSDEGSGRRSKRQFDIEVDVSPSGSTRKRVDEGLRDEEVEQFLQSRIKRGRGAVGSRMDETGPYLPSHPDTREKQLASLDVDYREGPQKRAVLGPAKPPSLWHCESSDDESSLEHKKTMRSYSRKQCSGKHRSKDKEKKKRKKTKEKSRKQHK